MLSDDGMKVTFKLISDDIDYGELGTGGTMPTKSDTALETATGTTYQTISKKEAYSYEPYLLSINYLLAVSGANNTYKEFGLFHDATSTMYLRIVFTSFTKVDYQEVPMIVTIEMVNDV